VPARTARARARTIAPSASEQTGPLPPELDAFLATSDHQSILIRGPAGSGKTMLAARILSVTPGPKLWVSTRSSGVQYPVPMPKGPTALLGSIRRVDLSVGRLADESAGPGLLTARRNLMELRGPDEDGSFLPPVLREEWQGLEGAPRPGIAFDSWEGLLDLYVDADPTSPLRWETLERYLLSRFAQRSIRLVLISERPTEGSLDYEVDSVLQTAVGELDERSIRVMSMPKLRGQALDETIYPYTLDGGEFRYLARVPLDIDVNRWTTEPEPTEEVGSIWPGSTDFAGAFGRLHFGMASLIEREEGVPSEMTRMISAAAAIGHVQRGHRVLIVPPAGVAPETIYSAYRRVLPLEEILRCVRLLTVPGPDRLPPEAREIIIPIRPPGQAELPMLPYGTSVQEEGNQPIFPEAAEFLLGDNTPGHPSLVIVDVSGFTQVVESMGRQPTPALFNRLLRELLEGRALHVLATSEYPNPILDPFRNFVRPYVRILARRGRVFALGNRPWTPAYVLVPPRGTSPGRTYELIRVS
jgi:hypothetical protein